MDRLRQAKLNGAPYHLALIDGCMPEMDGCALAARIHAEQELREISMIMMLSSDGLQVEADRCRALGITRYLLKPIVAGDLRDALQTTLGRSRNERENSWVPGSAEQPRQLHILLAEDNFVNQKVAVALLTKQGHTVRVAPNGRAADALCYQEFFAGVLMDLQMPEMDGFAATAALRGSARPEIAQLKILALTANAMEGDEQLCLDAGMDSYLAKPINAAKLQTAIKGMFADRSPRPVQPSPEPELLCL